jgi:sugar/nucleoside kinase (ribokinase family)
VIVLIGQSVIDRVRERGGVWVERLGGAPLFAGAALVSVGVDAVIVTRGAQALRAPLRGLGLVVVEGDASSSFVSQLDVYGDGERHHTIAALGDPFTPADVAGWAQAAVRAATSIVCGAQWREDFPPETLRMLGAQGRRVFLDGQGPARLGVTGPVRLDGPVDPRTLPGVYALKCSEEEADALLGGRDAASAATAGVEVVVVTLGVAGAVVFWQGGSFEVRAEPVRGLADTIGAGDAFLALFAAAVDAGASPPDAAAQACATMSRLLRERLQAGA